jgi:glycosyltransferase involved in cell wall biosynthesis
VLTRRSVGEHYSDHGRRRLVLLTHDLTLGGLEQVVMTLARMVDSRRFDVSVLCLWELGAFGEQLIAEGFTVDVLAARHERTAFRKVARYLRRERVDVLHTHNTPSFLYGSLGAFLARTPTVVHTDHARDFPDRTRYMVAEHIASHLVYRVVGVSEHTTNNLRRYEKIPRRKLLTIPNGIDGSRFRQPVDVGAKRRELGIPDDSCIVGLASRLTPQKDIPNLLRAMCVVVRELPNVTLLIVGEGDGSEKDELRARANALGIGEHVRFLGMRFDIPELLATFDVYASSSAWEGLPMVILEAMAAGCPIVATAVGGLPSAISNGVNGTLVPPHDSEALAAALIDLLRDRERRARYARAARDVFAARYSAEIMARRYEALYERRPLPVLPAP